MNENNKTHRVQLDFNPFASGDLFSAWVFSNHFTERKEAALLLPVPSSQCIGIYAITSAFKPSIRRMVSKCEAYTQPSQWIWILKLFEPPADCRIYQLANS
jgi:hypothetical protein